MLNLSFCPTCNSDNFQKYIQINNWKLDRCKNCKAIFLNPRPDENEIQSMYNERYFSEISKFNTSTDLKKSIYSLILQIEKINNTYGMRSKILEVGAGYGHLLAAAKTLGYTVAGIEISQQACQFAKESFDLALYCGTTENFSADYKFDLIIFNHSLEHLPSPIKDLRKCYELLSNNGLVWITLPNVMSFDRFYHGDKWDGWHLPFHFFHYSPHSIRYLLEMVNFSGIKIEKTFFNPLVIYRDMFRRARVNFKVNNLQLLTIRKSSGKSKRILNLLRNPITSILSGQNMTVYAVK